MVIYATIKDHTMRLTPIAEQLRKTYLAGIKDDVTVKIEITQQREGKTTQQLRAFWGYMLKVTKQALDDAGYDTMGVPLTQEQVKEILYHFCGQVGESGEVVRLSKQSKMQTVCFFENVAAWLATNFHVTNALEFDTNWKEHIGANKES